MDESGKWLDPAEAGKFAPSADAPARRCRACALAVLAALGGALAWAVLPLEQAGAIAQETGAIERATELLYGLAALVLAWGLLRGHQRPLWAALLGSVLAFGAREMDWHTRWTPKSVLKLSYYLGEDAVAHKLVAGIAVAACLLALLYVALRWIRALPRWRTWLRSPPAQTAVVFLATMVLSKVLDRSTSLLQEDVGLLLPAGLVVFDLLLEESLELALPLMAALGGWQLLRQQRARAGLPRP